jgi:hypothetical protein
MKERLVLLTLMITSLFLLSACQLQGNCKSHTDCNGASACLNGKCTTIAVYKDLATSQSNPASEEKKEPVLEVVELCETEDPNFNPSDACHKIRVTKYADRMVCDSTVGPPTWYNMGSCYNCIVSCR